MRHPEPYSAPIILFVGILCINCGGCSLFGRFLASNIPLLFPHIPTICCIGPPKLPLELMDMIIDHLHEDRGTLLRLSRVSKQTLTRSRRYLFCRIQFNEHGDCHFDAFLALLESPWTTLAPAIECLVIMELFFSRSARPYKYRERNVSRIVSNLPHLKSLWLTRVRWVDMAPHIRCIFLQLPIRHLRLSYVTLRRDDLFELLPMLPSSIKTMTMYNLQYDYAPDLSAMPSSFLRNLRLRALDSHSLIYFKDVWDPSLNNALNLTVESFYLRLIYSDEFDRYAPLIKRFMQHIGPSFRRLLVQMFKGREGSLV
jgi:hypothetical protein